MMLAFQNARLRPRRSLKTDDQELATGDSFPNKENRTLGLEITYLPPTPSLALEARARTRGFKTLVLEDYLLTPTPPGLHETEN
jgi:hypothetical protein